MDRRFLIVLGVLVLGAGVLLFTQLQRREVVVERGLVGEARRNPLLALERTLSGLGLSATSRRELRPLPPEDHVLVVLGTGEALGEEGVGELLGWVGSGGHAVVLLPSEGTYHRILRDETTRSEIRDPLLRALGLSVVAAGEGEDAAAETTARPLVEPRDEDRELRLGPDGHRLVAEDASPALRVPGDPGRPALMVHLESGEGALTIVGESAWATNASIGDADHAAFAWDLVRLAGNRAGARVLYGLEVPGAWSWLVGSGAPVLASALALLVLWAWYAASRFGPPLGELARDRRDFAEHLDASGEFLWRHGRSGDLLEAPRRAVERRLQTLRPSWGRGTEEERLRAASEASGLSPDEVAEALRSGPVDKQQQMTRVVRNLRILEDSL